MAPSPAPITRGRSAPANPSLPSLLTTLPPEIRNKIYELLFVQHDTVEISQAYPHSLNIADASDIWRREWQDEEYRVVATRNRTTRLSLVNAVALLRTCRQIYHETIGIIYSQNNFVLSTCNRQERSIGDWIHTIAFQKQFLRKVTVNVRALGGNPWACWTNQDDVEVLPLLRIVWDLQSPNLEILLCDCAEHASGITKPDQVDLEYLNATLHLIGHEDNLKLRQYTVSEKLLESVTLSLTRHCGAVQYGRIYGEMPSTRFITSSNGRSLIKKSGLLQTYGRSHGTSTLWLLPEHIYYSILDYATWSAEDIVISMPATKIPIMRQGIFWVNKQMRLHALKSFLMQNSFVYIITSHSPRIFTLQSKAILGTLLPLASDHTGYHYLDPLAFNQANILFEFRLQQKLALKDVTINVVDLLCVTMKASDSTTIRCRIVQPNGSDQVETSFTLRSLRINAFLILSHFLEAKARRTKHCPAVYINGDGYAVEMIKSGRTTYQQPFDTAKLISEQMEGVKAGEKYVPKFTIFAPPHSLSHYFQLRPWHVKSKPTLIELWGSLRELYWSEKGQTHKWKLLREYEGFGCIDSNTEEVDEVDATKGDRMAVALAEEYWNQVD